MFNENNVNALCLMFIVARKLNLKFLSVGSLTAFGELGNFTV
jgi:hypothetical protein